jgi:hypothetical protein
MKQDRRRPHRRRRPCRSQINQVHEGWDELGHILQSSMAESTLESLVGMRRKPLN